MIHGSKNLAALDAVFAGEAPPSRRPDRPAPDRIRAVCPCCGSDVVSNWYFTEGKGYILRWDCWEAMGSTPTCSYRRIL